MRKGWEIKKLADVVDFQRGLTYSKKDEVDFSDNIVLRSNNVSLITNKLDFSELKYINAKVIIPESKKVTKGSLIICTANGSKSHLGKVALIDDDYNYAFGGFMGLIKPKENLNSIFLFYLMTSDAYKKFISELSDGANINNLKFSDLGDFEIPLPPLSEQQEIVSILDDAFESIERAKSNAEQNLKNAKELFESYLQNVFDRIKLKQPQNPLSEYLELITYGFTNPMPTTDSGPYMVTAKNVKGGIVDYNTSRRTSQYAFDNLITDKCRPKKGDVLLTKDGTLGRLAVVEKADMCINQSVALLRPSNKLNPFYLKHLLSSNFYQKLMTEQAGGATIKHIYITRVDKMKIPVPPIEMQKSINTNIEVLSAETKRLENIYLQKLNDLEELKKSILQKAFNGELKTSKIST